MSHLSGCKLLLFDVFGTLVDYRTTVIKEGEQWNKSKNININWPKFIDEWRGRYRPSMDRVLRGELPWMNLDQLHRLVLKNLLNEFEIECFSEDEIDHLNKVWHRLEPWNDTVAGLHRLKQKFIISPLSNGNISLLTNMAKHSGLPWDLILSPELIRSYKPEPNVYKMAIELFDLQPHQVMMVAAHQYDLQAAKELGMKTAYILRPLEYGHDAIPDLRPTESYDVIANDIIDLAKQVGA
ncbi:haloacid dehalogenase type II [Bacillus sp. FJAT-45350]|uniref:haloacid dehalogenase type II n=1 Tax=Bacillus sp. FJAT-45350 TaxID=2011014 RepID=UPI000BB962C9|nr:haloacid dehalogenase type II [Bacillus sp. FJAT-45350]